MNRRWFAVGGGLAVTAVAAALVALISGGSSTAAEAGQLTQPTGVGVLEKPVASADQRAALPTTQSGLIDPAQVRFVKQDGNASYFVAPSAIRPGEVCIVRAGVAGGEKVADSTCEPADLLTKSLLATVGAKRADGSRAVIAMVPDGVATLDGGLGAVGVTENLAFFNLAAGAASVKATGSGGSISYDATDLQR